jgi:hypothetical protein
MFFFGDDMYFKGDTREKGLDGQHHNFFPAVIVRPSCASQVVALIKFASANCISVRSGICAGTRVNLGKYEKRMA